MTDIIGFNGPPRSYKTASVALLGLHYWRRGYNIISNFPFYSLTRGRPYPLEERYRLVEPLDLMEMVERAANYDGYTPLYANTVFCGQEMQSWLESRLGRDLTIIMMANWVLYSGKMGVSIFYDTQLNSSVDKRLKENASKRFFCENKKNRDYVKFYELDLEETEKNVPTGAVKRISKEFYRKHVFPYYNTYKITKPIGFDAWLAKVRSK